MLTELLLHKGKALVHLHNHRIVRSRKGLVKLLMIRSGGNDKHILLPLRHRPADIGRNAKERRNAGDGFHLIVRRILELIENIHVSAVQHGIPQGKEHQILPFIQLLRNDFAVLLPLLLHSSHVRIHLEHHGENCRFVGNIGLGNIKGHRPFLLFRFRCNNHIRRLDSFHSLHGEQLGISRSHPDAI